MNSGALPLSLAMQQQIVRSNTYTKTSGQLSMVARQQGLKWTQLDHQPAIHGTQHRCKWGNGLLMGKLLMDCFRCNTGTLYARRVSNNVSLRWVSNNVSLRWVSNNVSPLRVYTDVDHHHHKTMKEMTGKHVTDKDNDSVSSTIKHWRKWQANMSPTRITIACHLP